MRRRDVLMGMAALGLSSVLNPDPRLWAVSPRPASQDPDHFLVFFSVWGGMDVTLGLDPWLLPDLPDARDMFIEYRQSDLIEVSESLKVGPAAGFLKKYRGQFSIVNGLFMSEADLSHEVLRDYMVTGNLAQQAAPFALEASLAFEAQDGFGAIIDNARYPRSSKTLATPIASVVGMERIDADLADVGMLMDSGDRTSYGKSALRAKASVAKLQRFLELKSQVSGGAPLSEGQAIALSFLSGCSRFAHLDYEEYDLSMDTHFNHPQTHLRLQTECWDKIDTVMSEFKRTPYGLSGKSLFDHTTFVVVNEFSRTPYLNPEQGKHHNTLTNSVLFLGKGIPAGRVIGGSKLITRGQSPTGSSYHIAQPIDFSTGLPQEERNPQGRMIFPEHIIATLCHVLGMDPLRIPGMSKEILPLF